MPINASRGGTITLTFSEDLAEQLLDELAYLPSGSYPLDGAVTSLMDILGSVGIDPIRRERPDPPDVLTRRDQR